MLNVIFAEHHLCCLLCNFHCFAECCYAFVSVAVSFTLESSVVNDSDGSCTYLGTLGIATTYIMVSIYCRNAQGTKENTIIYVIFAFGSAVTMLVRVAALTLAPWA